MKPDAVAGRVAFTSQFGAPGKLAVTGRDS